jgi:hypothetical protein
LLKKTGANPLLVLPREENEYWPQMRSNKSPHRVLTPRASAARRSKQCEQVDVQRWPWRALADEARLFPWLPAVSAVAACSTRK